MALLSDVPLASQVAKARAHGMQRWCSVQVFTDVWGSAGRKLAQIGFRQIQAILPSLGPYAYIADNPLKDFIAPRELGWRTVRVRREGGLYAYIEAGSVAFRSFYGHSLNRIGSGEAFSRRNAPSP